MKREGPGAGPPLLSQVSSFCHRRFLLVFRWGVFAGGPRRLGEFNVRPGVRRGSERRSFRLRDTYLMSRPTGVVTHPSLRRVTVSVRPEDGESASLWPLTKHLASVSKDEAVSVPEPFDGPRRMLMFPIKGPGEVWGLRPGASRPSGSQNPS